MNQDLKIIKKKYGEKMAHFCREYFPSLLEREGLLLDLMLNNFEPNHNLYDDIIKQKKEDEFKNYIYSLVDVEKNNEIKVVKNPKELLADAGYDLYECKSEKDIQSFKKYYAKGETLCTFHGKRLDRCYVFFAVKKNVDKIKRENYPNPQRQDEYGTSVISIQFDRSDAHTLSIKNRYNHRVNNPDNTFGNNLDNIIEGLTESFGKFYDLVQQHSNGRLELEGYVRANDGKYYKYNLEKNNVYYCPNNIIIDNFEVKRYEKEKYIIFNYFILDLVKKEVRLYDQNMLDSFPYTMLNIRKIEVEKKDNEKEIKITLQDNNEVIIVLDKDNRMIKYENQNIQEVKDYFLAFVPSLQELSMPNLQKAGEYFVYFGNNVRNLYLPKLKIVGNGFLSNNLVLEKVDLPSLEEVGDNFLMRGEKISYLNLPYLKIVGNNFMFYNESLEKLDLPLLEKVDDYFLNENIRLKEVSLPSLKIVGYSFLRKSLALEKLDLPSLEKAGDDFLFCYRIFKKENFLSFKIGSDNFDSIINKNNTQDIRKN